MLEFIGTARTETGRHERPPPDGTQAAIPQTASTPIAAVPDSWIAALLLFVIAGCAVFAIASQ